MTPLTKSISRVSNKTVSGLPVVITIAPGTDKRDDLIGLRLKGKRTQYVLTLSDLYRLGAMWHGQKVASAKREARKHGIPWRTAKKQFNEANRL